jgi:hypothetical protein
MFPEVFQHSKVAQGNEYEKVLLRHIQSELPSHCPAGWITKRFSLRSPIFQHLRLPIGIELQSSTSRRGVFAFFDVVRNRRIVAYRFQNW